MTIFVRGLGMACLLFVGAVAAVPDVDETQRARYHALLHELRCVVCQNQSIAESNAPLAQDLRGQVATQINAGRSNDEIRGYLTDRYGDFVLYKPPLRARTLALWGGPFILLALGLLMAWRHTRRRQRAPDQTEPASSDKTAVQGLLDRYREGER